MASQVPIDKEAELIEAVRERSFLYDLKTQGYKDPIQKANAWTSISTELNYPTLDAKACEALWNKIKKQYTGFLRKRKSLPTGSASQAAEFYFRHENAMAFYADHYRPYKSVSNVPSEFLENNSVNDSMDGTANLDIGTTLDIQYHGFDEDMERPEVVAVPSVLSPLTSHNQKTPVLSNKRKKPLPIDPMDELLVKALADSKAPEMDEYELFCSSLAPKLRRIAASSPKNAAILQLKIQELFISAEFDE